jgi:acyl-CoA dehydrogenase
VTVPLFVAGIVAAVWILAYLRVSAPAWTIVVAAILAAATAFAGWQQPTLIALWSVLAIVALLLNPTPLRRAVLGRPLLGVFRRVLPPLSNTEREAIEAGTVWWDAELFSGAPDWEKLLSYPKPKLTAEEQAFLDGPVETLCRMLDEWEIARERHDLPPDAWQFIKDNGFLGMIIPKEYGGLGFSALAHSSVIVKLTTRSGTGAVSVMVPNSLGPAELLMHSGTDEQKKRLLPRLASGEDIPAFALTEPGAGSDAGAIASHGTLFKGTDGKLYIRLNWNKRYITLAAIATLLGVAFKLSDPDNLLGQGEDLGITCALVPTNTAGVVIGRRHDPLGVPFYNCPTQGHDVVVSVDAVVGGVEGCARGEAPGSGALPGLGAVRRQ